MSSFKQAKRKAVPLKIALQGVSFSGKTMSSIKLAKGLAKGKPVCVIDTENESANLYDHLDFLHAPVAPPFKPDKFVALIREAVDAGAGCIVIDSLSHAWQYILDYKDQLDQAKGRADWGHWAKAKPLWTTLKDAILQCPVHVVVTFREKADYAVDSNDDGRGNRKNEVKKLGTKAVAEEGTEYEFTTVWKLDKDTHLCRVEKDRTGLFDGRTFILDEGIGRELLNWLGDPEAFEAGTAWMMLSESNPEEFQAASSESEKFRRDQARAIANRRQMKAKVVSDILETAKSMGADGVQLILDADRYGATTADRIIRFVCTELKIDPVRWERMQLEEGPVASAPKTDGGQQQQQRPPQNQQQQQPVAQANGVVTHADGSKTGEEGAAQLPGGGEPPVAPKDQPASTSAETAPASDAPATHTPAGSTNEPPVEGTATQDGGGLRDTAFGFKVARLPLARQFEQAQSGAQEAMVKRKMGERNVSVEMVPKVFAVIANEFGVQNHATSGAHSLVIDFLNNANEEQFDLAFARADSNEQGVLIQ